MAEYPDYDRHQFLPDVAEHEMAVLHDDGLYRHLRFMRPDSGFYWFDLVTWPGNLAFRAHPRGHMFAAARGDMFEFFRGSGARINPHYWAEKLPGLDTVTAYSEDRFHRHVICRTVEAVMCDDAPAGLEAAVRAEVLIEKHTASEDTARAALERFEHDGFRFRDVWEWDFRDYTWQYLWACHAIAWGIARYDRVQRYELGRLADPRPRPGDRRQP